MIVKVLRVLSREGVRIVSLESEKDLILTKHIISGTV